MQQSKYQNSITGIFKVVSKMYVIVYIFVNTRLAHSLKLQLTGLSQILITSKFIIVWDKEKNIYILLELTFFIFTSKVMQRALRIHQVHKAFAQSTVGPVPQTATQRPTIATCSCKFCPAHWTCSNFSLFIKFLFNIYRTAYAAGIWQLSACFGRFSPATRTCCMCAFWFYKSSTAAKIHSTQSRHFRTHNAQFSVCFDFGHTSETKA